MLDMRTARADAVDEDQGREGMEWGGTLMIDYQDIFGKQLQRAMDIRGVGVRELSKLSLVPERTIYHYKSGEKPPTFQNLVAIGKVLHVSLDWLCGMRVKEDGNG